MIRIWSGNVFYWASSECLNVIKHHHDYVFFIFYYTGRVGRPYHDWNITRITPDHLNLSNPDCMEMYL